MKKISLITGMAVLCLGAKAQYKKASFFTKEGKTYELGTNISFVGNGGGKPVLSIVYSGSLEGGKRVSLFSDIELMLKGNMSYNATYYNGIGIPTTGKLSGETPMYLLVKYGAQYRFISSEKVEEAKLVPYARLGLLYGMTFSSDYKLKDQNGNPISGNEASPATPEHEIPFGLEAGAGVTYFFSKNFGIKVGADYRQFFHISGINTGSNSSDIYYPLKSHPGISIALKYRVFGDN